MVRVLRESYQGSANQQDKWRSVLTHTHTYSGQCDHGGTIQPPESYERLSAWARRLRIGAIGMGSPYTPQAAATYARYDHDVSGQYYQPNFDQCSVMDGEDIHAMLHEVNRRSRESTPKQSTLFYLDNETPKGRYGHLWWVGYHYDFPAWHDYDQPFDRWMADPSRIEKFEDEPMPYERRPYTEIVATQRRQGAVACWAHPTSWWFGDGGQFITNIASEMPAHLIADGFLDGLVVMGYHPYRPEYQALWFDLLDRGYHVNGVAEMDCGLSDPALWKQEQAMLNSILRDDKFTSVEQIADAFRQGKAVASSGPLVNIKVDGVAMGGVATTSQAHQHRVCIEVWPTTESDILGAVELLSSQGRVLWRRDSFTGGEIELEVPGSPGRSYIIARVFGQSAQDFAISNPVYLQPRNAGFPAPSKTQLKLKFTPTSPYRGGRVLFENAHGELLSEAKIQQQEITELLPANGRITLVNNNGTRSTHYLINANKKLQNVQRYLYRGRFLRDFPDAQPGEVPPQAWQFERYLEAMQRVELVF